MNREVTEFVIDSHEAGFLLGRELDDAVQTECATQRSVFELVRIEPGDGDCLTGQFGKVSNCSAHFRPNVRGDLVRSCVVERLEDV